MGSKPKDLTGNRYGRLIAIERLDRSLNAGYLWKCLCDCGNFTTITIGNLNSGHSKSCGCFKLEVMSTSHTTHGMHGTKEYKSWLKMRERCLNINDKEYINYGAIGITIQESWISNFENFIEYMGKHPQDGKKYSIDRLENSKGYIEGNVRWATNELQARNKSKLVLNTSGVNGVIWDNKVHPNGINSTLYCNAVWSDMFSGKQCKKCFSTKKYGLLPAFKMACEHRAKMIAELNSNGAGYTTNHGK